MTISTVDELTASFRSLLVEVSQLDGKFVRNALSEYGTSLDKKTDKSIFESISNSDLLILFEINSDNTKEAYSMTESDDSISYFIPIVGKLTIYGKRSYSKSTDMIAKLRSSVYRQKFIDNGMYLDKVSKANTLYEFQNNSLWNRADFTISFSSHLKILPFFDELDFRSADINVKETI